MWDLNRSFDHALNQAPVGLKKRKTNASRTSGEENLWRKKVMDVVEQHFFLIKRGRKCEGTRFWILENNMVTRYECDT